MSIIFITGVSTAGKTTAYKTLRRDPDLAGIEFHDIDEDGIPAAGSGPWRHFRVELLLHEAVTRFKEEGTPTVICGLTKPHEAIESGSFPDDIPVHFALVDIPMATIRKRLEARLGGRVSKDSLEMAIQGNQNLSHLMRKSVQGQRNGLIVNPARLSRTKVCQLLKSIILDVLATTRPSDDGRFDQP
jgi:hypothetical protein